MGIFQLEEDYMYSVVAMKPCEFHSISEDGFKHQYRNMPELHKQMFVNFLRSRTFAPHDGASRTGIMTCSSSVHSRRSPSMKPTRWEVDLVFCDSRSSSVLNSGFILQCRYCRTAEITVPLLPN